MLPPDKTKIPKTKKKQRPKVRIQLTPAENALSSLGLTARETEVLTWIAQGKTNYEIGVILSACTGTICKHVEHILCKLEVKNRTAAAVIALAALAGANMSQRVRAAGSRGRRYRRGTRQLVYDLGGSTVSGCAT